MDTIFYFVRHGQTTWNRDGRVQGWADTRLTDRGRRQARGAAEQFETVDVDCLASSDLYRAHETMNIIQSRAFPSKDIHEDERLREQDMGVLQGFSIDRLGEVTDMDTNDPEKRYESGESLADTRERVVDWCREVADSDVESVLVASHSGPIKQLLGRIEGHSPTESIEAYTVKNCSVTAVGVDEDGTWRVLDTETIDEAERAEC